MAIKQWHKAIIQEIQEQERQEPQEYIKIEMIPTTTENKDGSITTKYEEHKTTPFRRVNESAKALKVTQMQQLLNKINDIEKGL